jgi:hypothetical protein
MEHKYGSQTPDSDFNSPATKSVDYTHELTRFTKSLKQRSLSFAFFEAKESRQKGDFNKAMLMVSEVVRDHVTALRNLQKLFDELSGRKPKQVVFQKFRQFEPLEVGMENAPDVFRILNKFVNPWKSEKSELVTTYFELEKQVVYEQKRSAVMERFASTAEDSRESVEQQEQLEGFIRNQETLQYKLGTAIIDIASDILKKMAAHLDHKERIKYQLQLLGPLITLILSDIRTKAAKDVDVLKYNRPFLRISN